MQAFSVHLPPPAAAQTPILMPEGFAFWALVFDHRLPIERKAEA